MKQMIFSRWSALSLAVVFVWGAAAGDVSAQAQGQAQRQPMRQPAVQNAANAQAGQATARKSATPPDTVPTMKSVAPAPTGKNVPEVLAEVNGEKIERQLIIQEAYWQHCEEVLENRIKLMLIDQACKQAKIEVTPEEENAEIDKMCRSFGFTSQEWFEQILVDRGMTPEEYRRDILRPIIAIRKLAGQQLVITPEEIKKEYEALHGASVGLRQIVHNSQTELERIRKQALENPDAFSVLAKNHSTDPSSASLGGLIRPIFKHTTAPEIEKVVFSLKEDEISPVLKGPRGEFMIFKCEKHYPAAVIEDQAGMHAYLEGRIRDTKTRRVADDVFTELYKNAKIVNYLKSENAELAKQNPSIVAEVNGEKIRKADLAKYCMERYGESVLEEQIYILMLVQECKKRRISVTAQDVEAEIGELAARDLPLLRDGSPDKKAWIDLQVQNLKRPQAAIRNNMVRPIVMLKKLSAANVHVSDEDIQKGFIASYGPRAKCLAIYFTNMRIAQTVWQEANKFKNKDYFGDLAAEYSAHGPSKALRGEIPPIPRFGGAPELEKAAFSVAPGDISEVIQLGSEEFVILFGLGQTKPVVTDINDVKALIHEDIAEKKLALEMQKTLQSLHDGSRVANYLTGKSRLAQQPAETPPVNR